MTRTERNLHMGSPTKDAPTGTLTYSEAYALAQKGAKITHRFMAANEWMTVLPNGRFVLRTDVNKLLWSFGRCVVVKQDGQTVGAYLTKPNSEESARFTIRVNY